MLSKNERLGRSQFSDYFASGKRSHGVFCTLIVSPAPHFMAAVVVSKKVAKKAHERNSIRRRLYAILSAYKQTEKKNIAVIILTKPAVLKLTKKAFQQELTAEIGRGLNNR